MKKKILYILVAVLLYILTQVPTIVSNYKFGTAKLVNKHGKYYLHIPVTYEVEESNISDICNVVGID